MLLPVKLNINSLYSLYTVPCVMAIKLPKYYSLWMSALFTFLFCNNLFTAFISEEGSPAGKIQTHRDDVTK